LSYLAELGDWSKRYGYLDAKPNYYSESSANGPLRLKLTVGSTGIIWFCGGRKETLLHVAFYLDKLVLDDNEVADFDANDYELDPGLSEWKAKKFVGNECKELYNVIAGSYIVTLENRGNKTVSLSHVITW
jgi:hypothetical protein